MKTNVQIHFIHPVKGMLYQAVMGFVPNIGDEIRLSDTAYYKVTCRVWAMDEPVCPFERVNLGVVEVTPE